MKPLSGSLLASVVSLLGTIPICAQDLLGVTYYGAVVRIDSYTGAATPLGTGAFGQNALARTANGTFWSTRSLGTSYVLTNIDPDHGTATTAFPCGDLRALSAGPGNSLYGILDGSTDRLVQIDTATGAATTIGSTGFPGVQALAQHQGVLYGWDVSAGLLVVDPTTGAATAPFPGVSIPPFAQTLCSHPDGRLLLAGDAWTAPDPLYVVDTSHGTTTWIGGMVDEVRGLEPLGAFTVPLGQGCDGTYGQVTLAVTGPLQVGGNLTATSTNHAANAIGVLLFGTSATVHQGLSLPLLVDPWFATNSCRLYTSIDGSIPLAAGPVGPAAMQFTFAVPAGASGALLNLQHVALETVPGGMSWSNGVALQVR